MKRLLTLLITCTLAVMTLAPTQVLAHGPRVRVVRSHHHHGHFVLAPRPHVVRVAPVNYGSVDFNVRPQKSRIYVDGDYLGIADDFNGYPQTAKLSAGHHTVRVVSPGGQVETRRIYVAAGRELNFNLTF